MKKIGLITLLLLLGCLCACTDNQPVEQRSESSAVASPTAEATAAPTEAPSAEPTAKPTTEPTAEPTPEYTPIPTMPPVRESLDLNEEEEKLFNLIATLIYFGKDSETGADYETILAYGEDVPVEVYEKTWNGGEGFNVHKRMLITEMDEFYHEVMGWSDKFVVMKEVENHEVGVICMEDGYCYEFNAVGGGDYAIVKSVERFPDRIEIDAYETDQFEEYILGEFHFTVYPTDNQYGYSLQKPE